MRSPHRNAPVGGAEPFAWSTALVIGLVLVLAVGFEMLRGAYLPVEPFRTEASFGTSLVVALQVAATPLGVAVIFMALMGREWTDYGLWRTPLDRRAVWAIFLAAPAAALAWRVGGVPADLHLPAAGSELGSAAAALGIAAALAAGVAEELLVRGFLLNEIARLSGGRWGSSVLGVSIALGVGQLHRGGGAALAAVAAHGLFGLAYLLSRRSLPSVLFAHLTAILLAVYSRP